MGKESGMLIHAGGNRASKRKGGERQKERRPPKMAVNERKSSLPILIVKLKRQQAQTHESECDMFVEFSMAGTGSNQSRCLTFTVARDWQNKIYGAGNVTRERTRVCWCRSLILFLNQLQNNCKKKKKNPFSWIGKARTRHQRELSAEYKWGLHVALSCQLVVKPPNKCL